ncbi:MAG TPA: hypothetical protein VL961_03270 [Acidimicrobiales bacterium]|nr:hypothetical protein [Acidimicrobiales bacterium]
MMVVLVEQLVEVGVGEVDPPDAPATPEVAKKIPDAPRSAASELLIRMLARRRDIGFLILVAVTNPRSGPALTMSAG